MFKIGLNTPITVRKGKTGPILVAGLHRLEAAKLLGWKKIAAVQLPGSKSDARLWKGSENLHRADLTVLERSIEIERWRRHFGKVAKGAQVARPGGRQPKNVAIGETAKKLGFPRDEVSRARLIAGIARKVKAKLSKLGLDDNQAALLAIAKAPTRKEQRAKLKAIVKRKNAPRRKRPTHPNTGKNAQATEEAAFQAELNLQIEENKKLKVKLAAKRKKIRKLKNERAATDSGEMSIAPAAASPPTAPTHDEATVGITNPPTAPVRPDGFDDLELPSEPDRRDPEKAFAALKTAWFNAPSVARSRFIAEVLGLAGDCDGGPQVRPN
jgi:ParB family chromosome partitioning protein